MSTDADTRSIERELTIRAAPSDVWRALTDAREIARWFAPEAESTPSEGGAIHLRWDQHVEWTMPILEATPGESLVLRDGGATGDETAAGVIRYDLLPAGDGATVLRLTHSGFPAGDDWQDLYDGTQTGWTYELRCLRHYLERHPGRDRAFALAHVPVAAPHADAWRTLTGPRCLGVAPTPGDLPEGARVDVSPAVGPELTGRVLCDDSPRNLGLAVDQLDHAIVRATVERWSPDSPHPHAFVWISAWGADEREIKDLERRWADHLATVFAD